MQEQEENIQFDNMPNFRGMLTDKQTNDWDDEKVYDSLYDELLDKCRPDKFIGDTSDNKKFLLANQLYAELRSKQGCSDNELIELRDRAMESLGIHISTKKLYGSLEQYFNPQVYTTMESYDAERVALAGEYYLRLRECRDDIHALENLRDEAAAFIAQRVAEEGAEREKRKKEKEEEDNERLIYMIFILIGFVTVIIAIAISASRN